MPLPVILPLASIMYVVMRARSPRSTDSVIAAPDDVAENPNRLHARVCIDKRNKRSGNACKCVA